MFTRRGEGRVMRLMMHLQNNKIKNMPNIFKCVMISSRNILVLTVLYVSVFEIMVNFVLLSWGPSIWRECSMASVFTF